MNCSSEIESHWVETILHRAYPLKDNLNKEHYELDKSMRVDAKWELVFVDVVVAVAVAAAAAVAPFARVASAWPAHTPNCILRLRRWDSASEPVDRRGCSPATCSSDRACCPCCNSPAPATQDCRFFESPPDKP